MRIIGAFVVLGTIGCLGAAGPLPVPADAHGQRSLASATAAQRGSAPGAAAGLPDWVALGPFGGAVEDVAASPANTNIVLAGIAPPSGGGALYRSIDGGASWSPVPALNGISVYDVAFTPGGIAYIGTTESAWKSVDGGMNWTQLNLQIGLNDVVLEVAIDPGNANTIWAGIADALGGQPVNVMRSTNAGANWVNMTPPLAAPMGCDGIAVHPNDSNRVYACFAGAFGGGQVWVSANGGVSWVNRSAGLPNNPMRDIVHDGSRVLVAGGQLFGSQFVGLYASVNEGVNWTALHDGSWPLLVIPDIDIDPNDVNVILAASSGAGVYRSDDGGVSWQFGVGGSGSLSLNATRFSPGSSSVIYLGASSAGVLKSIDAGASFGPSSAGIGALNVFSVDANPNDPEELAIAFQGLNDGGVQTSVNGGLTWSSEPVPPTRYNTVRFAPDGTLYAISGGPSSVAPEGLYRRNAKGTWTGIGPDQGTLFESDLYALRFSGNDPGLIMAGGADFGVAGFEATIWRLPDPAGEWTKVYQGPVPNERVTAIEIVEDGTDDVMIASFSDFGTEPQTGGALRSINGGLGWSPSSTGLPAGTQGAGLCGSPGDVNTFYMADRDLGAGLGGVHRTTNGGQTWSNTGYTGAIVLDVACDENDDQVLYIGLFGADRVRRSVNAGATFDLFNTGLASAGSVQDVDYAAGPAPRLLLATTTGAYARDLPVPCPWDIDGSGEVAINDFLDLLAQWGTDPGGPPDFDGNGTVDVVDFLDLLAHWGPCAG